MQVLSRTIRRFQMQFRCFESSLPERNLPTVILLFPLCLQGQRNLCRRSHLRRCLVSSPWEDSTIFSSGVSAVESVPLQEINDNKTNV